MAAPTVLTPRDRHRLSLHTTLTTLTTTTLTTAGIPPHPDDAKAIDALSTLDDAVARAICRWLSTHAHPSTPFT